MRRILFSIVLISIIITSCSSGKKKVSDAEPAVEELNVEIADNADLVDLTDVDGYFFVGKVASPKAYLLDKADFGKYFQPAKTMTNQLTEIDFDTQYVGAIVLPETNNEVTISLDSTYLNGHKLHIVYSINQESAERSFSIVPSKLFAFDASLNVDSVVFRNGDRVETLLVK